jgi:hypothetical protein
VGRPLFRLWRYLLQVLFPFLVLPVGLYLLRDSLFVYLLVVPMAAGLATLSRSRWLWRFARHVWQFRTRTGDVAVLYYTPAAENRWELDRLLRQCRSDLDRLAVRFGFALRGRPAIYLFGSCADVGRVFGRELGGTILPEANAIVVGARGYLRELVRHEFGHLFGHRWNAHPSVLLCEGLAVWLQGTWCGEPIDAQAWPWIEEPGLELTNLLSRRFFYGEPQRDVCYILAGSFTAYLIRRFGWTAYRRLYRRSRPRGFVTEFGRTLGVSLEVVEQEWRRAVRDGGPLGRLEPDPESPWAAVSRAPGSE